MKTQLDILNVMLVGKTGRTILLTEDGAGLKLTLFFRECNPPKVKNKQTTIQVRRRGSK